jgi:RNA polymerase sigma factor (sigma-70 family)
MSEPEIGRLSSQVILGKPGLSWTVEEIEAVCGWLFERAQYRHMQYWGMRFLGSYAVAEDVEDAIAEFLEQKLPGVIQSFDPGKSTFLTYIVACLRQFCSRIRVNLEKRQVPSISLVHEGEQRFENSPELIIDSRFDLHRSLEDKQQAEAIQRALKVLPPQFSSVIVLHYFQGKSTAEMAREFGISETNAKVRLFRARHLLSELIHGEGKRK